LNKGQYTVNIEIYDLNDTTSRASTKFEIVTPDYPKHKISISDLQLAQVIQSVSDTGAKWNEVFKKSSTFVVPNPNLTFIANMQMLNFYFEIYNAKTFSLNGVLLKYSIYDASRQEIAVFDKQIIAQHDEIMENMSIPIDILPTGAYYIQAVLSYPLENPIDSVFSIKKFIVLNPEIPPVNSVLFTENNTFEKSEWATLKDDEVELEVKKALIIASNYEYEKINMLGTIDAKKRFLYVFWKDRDVDTTSTLNEALYNYRQLIENANKFYSIGTLKNGWSTDRGRILLKYGKPNQRDTKSHNGEKRAYESWFYDNIQGGVEFHFVDLNGYGNYQLVHSTAINEIRNFNWFNQYVDKGNTDPMQDLRDSPGSLEEKERQNQQFRR
jgi:GWxTD domain-containing protein